MADKLFSALGARAAVLTTDIMALLPTAGPPAERATISQLKTLLDTIYAPITGGAYVLKAGDTMTGLLTIAQATANTSALAVTGYSLTGANAQNMISFAGTWNTSGTPTGWLINITDTASNANSILADWRVSGLSKFLIYKSGALALSNSIFFTLPDNTPMFGGGIVNVTGANSTIGAEFPSQWNTSGTPTLLNASVADFASGAESMLLNLVYNFSSAFSVRKDGLVRVFNNINFLGDTSAFPALKRSATVLQSRLADDSNFSPLQGLLRTAANAVTGLGAGVLAATTNATLVITDASGQAYRVPCII